MLTIKNHHVHAEQNKNSENHRQNWPRQPEAQAVGTSAFA
ncbi:hypothetical protein JCM19233_982 [Vibrio astriarenae]|nr:hypothetical protein JCM19233_982 [Vibrio sp. C7]